MIVRLATNLEDYNNVWRLTHDVYVSKGYATPKRNAVLRHHPRLEGRAATKIFLTQDMRGDLLGTGSFTLDSGLGLPLEDAFPAIVANIRAENARSGRRLSAVWRLVTRPDCRHNLHVVMALYGAIVKWAIEHEWHTLLCTCHPHHESFYRRFLGFQRVGEPLLHPVFKSPAVLMRGEIERIQSVWQRIALRRSSARLVAAVADD